MNVRAFDLNLLVVFDALLIDRSVTRAAERLGLTQPALSNALSRLRDGVGDPLFERTRDGMQPTPRALAMAEPVQTALTQLGRALDRQPAPRQQDRRVVVAATSYAQCVLLPGVIRSLAVAAPGVKIDVRAADSPEAALTIDWTGRKRLDAGRSSVVVRDPLVCVAADGGSTGKASARPTKPSRKATAHGFNDDYLGALYLASQCDYVATVPRLLAEWMAPRLSLRILKPSAKLPDVTLRLHHHKRAESNDAASAVEACVIETGARLMRGLR